MCVVSYNYCCSVVALQCYMSVGLLKFIKPKAPTHCEIEHKLNCDMDLISLVET